LKQFIALHVRQLPCLHAVISSVPKCWKRGRYQTLGQDEEGDGHEIEDKRQQVNETFGQVMIRTSLFLFIGITVLSLVRNKDVEGALERTDLSQLNDEEFKRDSPLILYTGAIEIMICGACAHTAACMYKRRRYALRHPSESTGGESKSYTKIHLEKEAGMEERQLFRPSSDGLECLVVEAVRPKSCLDTWNKRANDPSPEELVEEALGNGSVSSEGAATSEPPPEGSQPREIPQVWLGSAVVAVNDVAGDVGMMQVQLTKPKVTLWVLHQTAMHPSQLDAEMFAEPYPGSGFGGGVAPPPGRTILDARDGGGQPADPRPGQPGPTFFGQATDGGFSNSSPTGTVPAAGPRCACLAFEDEEPQILTRWTVCGIVFGWVTMLPVLLMQPHEERPRQQLFRQYLLKPCLLILPIWICLWLLDAIEVLFEYEMIHPFYYFGIVHMVFPGVLVWYLIQMQVADERVVLEQRQAREAEVGCSVPVVIEDPVPSLLKELITINPVALVWIGACAAIPIVACSLLTPMNTARSKLAQGYVNIIYAPMIFIQMAFLYILYHVPFMMLPKLYLGLFVNLLSVPCFMVWCVCLVCTSRYGKQDLALVEKQRLQYAKTLLEKSAPGLGDAPAAAAEAAVPGSAAAASLVECTEAIHREWEFIYTA